MKGIKLYLLLKALQKEELKGLRKAVQSPYFNGNPTVIVLYEKLRKQHPNYEETPKSRRALYKKLFPTEAYNDGKLRRLFTYLTQVIEQFLLHEKLKKEEHQRQTILANIYKERNIDLLFKQTQIQTEVAQAEVATKSIGWYLEQFQLLQKRYASIGHDKYNPKDNTLSEAAEHLDSYYILQKMQLVLGIKSREKIFRGDFKTGFLPIPTKDVQPANELFQLYYQAYYLLTGEQSIDFAVYEERLFRLIHLLPAEDGLFLFYNGINYHLRLSWQWNYKERPTILRWYKWGLKQGCLIQNNQISPFTFSNVVHESCRQNEIKWATRFVKDFARYLPPAVKTEEIKYTRSIIAFYRHQFSEVLFGLSNYEFSTPYLLKTKILQLSAYFELFLAGEEDYIELLHTTLASFQTYLYRNDTFTSKNELPCLHFVQIMKGILPKLVANESEARIKKWLAEQIENKQPLMSERWWRKRFNLI